MNTPQKLPKKDEFSPVVVGVRIFVEKLSTDLMGKKSSPFPFLKGVCGFSLGLFNSPLFWCR